MNNLPYSEDGMDGGMFHPSVLDRKEREYQQYMDTQTPIAAQKIRNFVNGNSNHGLGQALPNEVLYDQNYVNQITAELERVKLQLVLTQRDSASKDEKLSRAFNNINQCNSTIERLDNLVTNLKVKLSKYE
ncbi:hypothetical protein LSO58_18480 (plasmid) [Acinetobacter ursingii]|uniref:Uncharacterized protein n=2 Tax=cellular organisms TaxID=131567 RepID=A0AA46NSN3_9GAMM|nr:hypothetical protein [Acinetobacter ursingii]UYF77423.1 hypothetical protein LSO58_18480 [Acinetobacter ursingii]